MCMCTRHLQRCTKWRKQENDGVGNGLIWTHPALEQVIGKARGVGSFVLPGTYRIPGARSTAAISQHRQRQQYVRRHQALRAGLPAPTPNSEAHTGDPDLHFDCGGAHQERKGPAFRSSTCSSAGWMLNYLVDVR